MDDAALRVECERCGAPLDDIPRHASGGVTWRISTYIHCLSREAQRHAAVTRGYRPNSFDSLAHCARSGKTQKHHKQLRDAMWCFLGDPVRRLCIWLVTAAGLSWSLLFIIVLLTSSRQWLDSCLMLVTVPFWCQMVFVLLPPLHISPWYSCISNSACVAASMDSPCP